MPGAANPGGYVLGASMARDVFISHSTGDQQVAAEVCTLLEARGLRCWIAPRDVTGGAVWDEAILDAIESTRTFLVILSSHANQSAFVKNEVNRAFAHGTPIVVFRIEDVQPGRSLELYLARHHWIEGFPPPLPARVDRLVSSITALLNPGADVSMVAPVPRAAAPAPTPPPRPRPLAPRPHLEIVDPINPRVVLIDKPSFLIGRRSSSDLVLTGADVSREHAEIVHVDGGFAIRDRGSRCGTLVNGVEVVERVLTHGDRIQLGRTAGTTLRFLMQDVVTAEASGRSAIDGGFRQGGALFEALRALGSAHVLDEVLRLVIDAAIQVSGAERGFIMLANPRGALEMTLARRQGHVSLAGSDIDSGSRKIPAEVFASGRAVAVEDLRDSERATAHDVTLARGIRYVRCLPLRAVHYAETPGAVDEPRPIGVLYLDGQEPGTVLSATAGAALETLAAEASVAIENARLYREAVTASQMDPELRMASQIQASLLPQARKSVGFCEAIGASTPCRAIGGDFFEYVDLPDGRFGFVLGDVSGKGVPAAILAAVLQGICAAQLYSVIEPGEMLTRINQALMARGVESRFATMFLGVVARDGCLTYANAGHRAPFLLTRDGLRCLEDGSGMPVGLFADAVYTQASVQLVPGDVLTLFSDGLLNVSSALEEAFGEARVRDVLMAAEGGSTEARLQAIFAAVRAFTQGVTLDDDVTAMVVAYLG